MERRFATLEDFFAQWRDVLDERARLASGTLSEVPGVKGLIVAGSMGRGDPWPLSDIDLLPIYDKDLAEPATREVVLRSAGLEAAWQAQGFHTGLDVGWIAFTDVEVSGAVAAGPFQAVALLSDMRWFHGLDKGYRGRVGYGPKELMGAFLKWTEIARYSPEVVSARLAYYARRTAEYLDDAGLQLGNGRLLEAALALHEAVKTMMGYLGEGWGGSGASFGRAGTRFERLAAANGADDLAKDLLALLRLDERNVERRMDSAPESVRERHRLSWRARQIVGEDVTQREDARDVLFALSALEFRHRSLPFEPWTGIDLDKASLADRIRRSNALVSQL